MQKQPMILSLATKSDKNREKKNKIEKSKTRVFGYKKKMVVSGATTKPMSS